MRNSSAAIRHAPITGVALVLAAGCVQPERAGISRLPDPIFDTLPRTVSPAPRPPAPVVVAPPAARVTGEIGWRPPRGISRRWRYIVIHHSASERGNASIFDRQHREQNHWDELGYHFVVGNGTDSGNGEIEVGSRWRKQKHGAHCRTPDNRYNEAGIGICLVGNFEHQPPSSRQMSALARLVAFLVRYTGVPISNIVTHRDVTHRTACPGRYLYLSDLKARLPMSGRASSAW